MPKACLGRIEGNRVSRCGSIRYGPPARCCAAAAVRVCAHRRTPQTKQQDPRGGSESRRVWRVVLFNVTYRRSLVPRNSSGHHARSNASIIRAPPPRDTMLAIAAQTDYSSSALAYAVRP